MFGFIVFYQVYKNLGGDCQKKLLRNIFSVKDVSISMISIRNHSIIFRFFDDNVFYQYIFSLEPLKLGRKVIVSSNRGTVNYLIYVYQDISFDFVDPLILFLNLLRSEDEYKIYLLLRRLL